jgi:antitoxin MazE
MQVAKWGNSLAVRLPKAVVEALSLKPGDRIEIVAAGDGRLVVSRDNSRADAIEGLRALRWPVPEGYRFDRDEANER